MRVSAGVLVAVIALCVSWSLTSEAARAAGVPTYNQSVAPILISKCVGCHREGGIAPMSLTTFESAARWAPAIKAKVKARQMPPWFADPKFGGFRNDRSLSEEEIQTIAEWVDGGAPAGAGTPPPLPSLRELREEGIGRPPDFVVESPEFELPSSGIIPVFTIWQPLATRERVWVEALRATPTNSRMVHHASVTVASLPAGTKLGSAVLWPGGPVIDGIPLQDGGPPREISPDTFGTPLLFYVPGGGVLRLAAGLGKALDPGKYLVWGFHFTTTGKPERGRLRLELWTARAPVAYEAVTVVASNEVVTAGQVVTPDANGQLALPPIPPYAANWEVTGRVTFDEDVTLHALWPHMHHRGKDMTFVVRYPSGREETLLSVPHYDFNWQLMYELAVPRKIPAGSTITVVAHYDNSAENHHNPDPSRAVEWGPQSFNEMFNPFLEITYDARRLK